MPSFQLVPAPYFSPTRCVTCSSSRDEAGFVDLLVESACNGYDEAGDPIHAALPEPTIGHLYICAGCLAQAAKVIGYHPAATVEYFRAQLDAAGARNEQLEAELYEAREDKVVPLAEVISLVEERAKRRPVAKPKAAA